MLAVMLRRDDKWKIRFDDGRELDHVDMCKMETWIRGMGAWLLRRDCTRNLGEWVSLGLNVSEVLLLLPLLPLLVPVLLVVHGVGRAAP